MNDQDNATQLRTATNQEKLIEQLKKIPIIEVACQKIGIGRNSYYRWYRQNKKFASACNKAIEDGCTLINDLAESQLISAMKNNNLTAVMYWLNHRHNAYKNKLEVSGGLEIKQNKLTKEQEKNIMRALELASLVVNEKGDGHEENKPQQDRNQKDNRTSGNKS